MAISELSEVGSRYGAPMGRVERRAGSETQERFYVQKVPIDSGGYDSGGAYWGLGPTLYRAESESGDHCTYFRIDRQRRADMAALLRRNGVSFPGSGKLDQMTARSQLRDEFPNARFFRRLVFRLDSAPEVSSDIELMESNNAD